MANQIRDQHLVDAAIAAGNVARAPKRGGGLLLDIPASRPRRLVNDDGRLTAEGRYFYEQVLVWPPPLVGDTAREVPLKLR